MAKILSLNSKMQIECDCGNVFDGTYENGLTCNKCGNFYEIALHLCPEHGNIVG